MNQVSLCKNLRSKEDSDKRGKGKRSFMDCHIKIGQLELWVTPAGVCDPALGAASASAVEPTCISTLRQLETAAFPQLITKSLSSASSKRNTEDATYPWHRLHTQESRGRPSTEFQVRVNLPGPWPVSSWSLPPHNWLCHCSIKQSEIHADPVLSSGIIQQVCVPGTWHCLCWLPTRGEKN